ncbi:hypothetical protein PMAC_002431 [Pneumocystis sp. 'macacae']|nr:hypothetical protein PMAC_002431 [Pneumocystis sp. 'macacae']
MSVAGSAVFCTACGALLDVCGDALVCRECGARFALGGMGVCGVLTPVLEAVRTVTVRQPQGFGAVLRQRRTAQAPVRAAGGATVAVGGGCS